MADRTEQDVYEEDPLALARAYGAEPVDPDETVKAVKDVGQFALESLPGVGTAFTVADIEDELKKEDPNYLKIGMLAGTEVIGLIPGLGTAAKNMIRKGADMARQTDEVIIVASSVPKISRKSTPSYTDADLLEADEIISEWGKGNLTNPELRSKLRDKGFNVETKRISPKMTGDDLEFVGPDGNIVRWKDMPRGQNRTPQMSNEDYDIRMAALDEIEDIKEWQQAAKKEIETGRVADPAIKTPELEESTRLLLDNKITREEHLANVDKYKPVNPWDALPREPSNKAVVFSLNDKQRQDGFFVLVNAAEMGVNKSSLKIGDLFNGRLDIPAYNRYDTWIVTGSSKNAEKGKHYAKAIHYRSGEGEPVKFIASEKTSERIGTGEIDKTPYATVQGYIEDLDADAIRAKAAEYLNDPEWTQVGFDPRRQGGFYVRAGENKHVPVREATEVIQIGPLILAKNAKLDFDYEGYSEGGLTEKEQMKMFGYTAEGAKQEAEKFLKSNKEPEIDSKEEERDRIRAEYKLNDESFSFKNLYNKIPTNARLLIENILGDDSDITEENFTNDELIEMILLAEKQEDNYRNTENRKNKGQPENVTTVSPYYLDPFASGVTTRVDASYADSLKRTFTDPQYRVATSLGRFDAEKNSDGLRITDEYDFNKAQRDLPKDLKGVLRHIRYSPEIAGEYLANLLKTPSRKVDINIPKKMSRGGTVMNKQMEMAFMQEGGITDDGMNVDPVSGNEVPPGSLAKEVRDDIPAQLSEGEYVVPADVVRFYGVKFFEDLRAEAKIGLAEMEANGRIGGEPVPEGGPKMGGALTAEEEAAVASILGMAEGGPVQNPYLQQQQLYRQSPPQAMGNSMMGMDQGGTVRGFAPGGDNPPMPSFGQTQMTTPTVYNQPNYSFLSPSQPQLATITKEKEGPFEPVKMINPKTNQRVTAMTKGQYETYLKDGYIVDDGSLPQSQPSNNNDGGGTPPPPGGGKGTSIGFKNWGDGIDWSDPESIMKFVDDSAAGLIDPKTGKKMAQIGVALGGPGLGTLAGVAGSVPTMQSVSDMRAAAIIARAQGKDGLAATIDGKIEDIMKNSSGFTNFIDKFFGEVMDGDAKAKARLNKLGLKFDEDDNGNPTFSAQQIAANKTKMGGGTKPPVESKSEKEKDPFADFKTPGYQTKIEKEQSSGDVSAATAEKIKQSTKDVTLEKREGATKSRLRERKENEATNAGANVGAGPGGSNKTGPMNKGGLMTKGKKKK